MNPHRKIKTLGELRESGYAPRSVREEIRGNLIARMETGQPMFPGLVGYDHTVIPRLENALLAGHDIILLGQRGQGKTRLIRALVSLLDEDMPIIRGSEVNDSPFHPISRYGQETLADRQDRMDIEWVPRQRRYTEKLATPDTTISELIGEVDPVKVAEGRYLSDELTIHFGLVPRANRGIFAINELPDLSERVQVGLFNILEERDLQIKGYKIQLPLDILVVATANPEDYTNRGRIITPLKDRYAAHLNTHYPLTRAIEMEIVEREAALQARGGRPVEMPRFLQEVVSEITFQARASHDVNQLSGVSVRMSIANMESLVSNAEKRALRLKEPAIAPRLSDLHAILASTEGKLELEYSGQDKTMTDVVNELMEQAVLTVFNERLDAAEMDELVGAFRDGWWVEVSDELPGADYRQMAGRLPGAANLLAQLGVDVDSPHLPAALEFLLEGLYLNDRLHRELVDGKTTYHEAQKIQPLDPRPDMA
ncbi:MAG: sigma 54-interacting transcriptional regulator [Deltaproteobacteria bacterium]|nr:sigma 54-interacting transcriptional regulator [Deltaproteobacteria bacterium]